jgi:L-ascorbate metabolism protein UlaG (beta-lactamase superfamily)
MKIRWLGHACFEIQKNDVTVVTDPHDGKQIGLAPPNVKADIILQSHDHFDHNAVKVVKGNPKVVKNPGSTELLGVRIKGVQVFHDEVQGDKRGKNIIFRFTMNGITLCHLGDLGHVVSPDIAAELGKIDILFTPVGSVFTIDHKGAWEMVRLLKPRVVVPMHYKTGSLSLNIQDAAPFLGGAPKEKITQVGNEVEFDEKDLPAGGPDVWVFSL